jgi:hypothetical protein
MIGYPPALRVRPLGAGRIVTKDYKRQCHFGSAFLFDISIFEPGSDPKGFRALV